MMASDSISRRVDLRIRKVREPALLARMPVLPRLHLESCWAQSTFASLSRLCEFFAPPHASFAYAMGFGNTTAMKPHAPLPAPRRPTSSLCSSPPAPQRRRPPAQKRRYTPAACAARRYPSRRPGHRNTTTSESAQTPARAPFAVCLSRSRTTPAPAVASNPSVVLISITTGKYHHTACAYYLAQHKRGIELRHPLHVHQPNQVRLRQQMQMRNRQHGRRVELLSGRGILCDDVLIARPAGRAA